MSTAPSQLPLQEKDPLDPERRLVAAVSRSPWRHFARHFVEMTTVMAIGMFAAGFVFMVILNLAVEGDVTWEQALFDYPTHALLAIAIGMSVPMIPWMRWRGHSRRSAYEMAIVMAIPAIPFICLAVLDVVDGALCGLYCIVGLVAMIALMLIRRDEYTLHR